MDKEIEKLIALGVIGLAGGLILGSRKNLKITEESNSDLHLKRFNEIISIPLEKVVNLQKARETIKTKVRDHLRYQTNLPIPTFYIQGSYKMKTIVENRNLKCDVDLAVIFPRDPGVRIETLQNHLRNALWNHTTKGVTVKSNCVRLGYVRDFHIDLPVYYKDCYTGEMYFGSRDNQWTSSDPKAFVEWFKSETHQKPQLVRIIRYLKAWADYTKFKTGKKFLRGLTLTLWVIKYYKVSRRDDVALFHTCIAILEYLDGNFKFSWSAEMPVKPFDNVLKRLSKSQISGFYDEFKKMVSIMTEAVSSGYQPQAISKWQRIFGARFR
jgi:hypothetical protein